MLQTDAAWAVGKVGECLGVISRLVSLDFDQRSAQETVAMPQTIVERVGEVFRVNALKSDFSSHSVHGERPHYSTEREWNTYSQSSPPPIR